MARWSTWKWLVLAAMASLPIGTTAQAEAPDAQFATEAASGSRMEVELGRHAAENARHPEVKQFGQRMAEAHGQASNELRQVAQQSQLPLPDQLMPEHRQQVQRLTRLEGDAFDRAYIEAMVKDHEQDLQKFRQQAQGESAVDRWAAMQVPVLERHLAIARDLDQQIAQRGVERETTPAALPREQGRESGLRRTKEPELREGRDDWEREFGTKGTPGDAQP